MAKDGVFVAWRLDFGSQATKKLTIISGKLTFFFGK